MAAPLRVTAPAVIGATGSEGVAVDVAAAAGTAGAGLCPVGDVDAGPEPGPGWLSADGPVVAGLWSGAVGGGAASVIDAGEGSEALGAAVVGDVEGAAVVGVTTYMGLGATVVLGAAVVGVGDGEVGAVVVAGESVAPWAEAGDDPRSSQTAASMATSATHPRAVARVRVP